jgi:hypothetical protein
MVPELMFTAPHHRSSSIVSSVRVLLTFVACFIYSNFSVAQHVVELRRTFTASDCATGELYIDGRLRALFYSSVSLFSNQLKDQPVFAGKATSEIFTDPIAYLGKTFGSRISTPNGRSIRLIAIDRSSYWQYQRPRKKARSLPADVLLVGTKVLNRECTISSYGEDDYYDTNFYYAWASDILAQSLFDGKLSRGNYGSGVQTEAVFMFTDASEKRVASIGSVVATLLRPRDADESIAAGDPCLTRAEHMANTIVSNGGVKSYQRRDDVWFCPNGPLVGAVGKNFIELQSDLRYWSFVSDEICGSVLGIPINRRYLIGRTEYGKASAAWSRCFATDDWKTISDNATVEAM